MTTPNRDLFLITGIPGTGKTTFGNTLAMDFGFAHYDLEDSATVSQCAPNPDRFIDDVLRTKNKIVVTWGFVPDHQYSVATVCKFKDKGFELIWFDGNRQAALKIFQTRAKQRSNSEADYDRQMEEFYLQMNRIEATKIVETLKPVVIDPFDAQGDFKPAAMLFDEIRR
jgi:adenylate kinase family enzyme